MREPCKGCGLTTSGAKCHSCGHVDWSEQQEMWKRWRRWELEEQLDSLRDDG